MGECEGCTRYSWVYRFDYQARWGADEVWLCAECAGLPEDVMTDEEAAG